MFKKLIQSIVEFFNRPYPDPFACNLSIDPIMEISKTQYYGMLKINRQHCLGKFYFFDDFLMAYVGIDNSTGAMWVCEFDTLEECAQWLDMPQ